MNTNMKLCGLQALLALETVGCGDGGVQAQW
jgi:hypothetical protein